MPRFAANLSMLFTEVPFLDRFAEAARVGFSAVEFQNPYSFPAIDIRSRLEAHDLVAVQCNSPTGTRPGDRGLAALPGREDDFWVCFQQAFDYANKIDCKRIRIVCGHTTSEVSRERMIQTLVDNLKRAAPVAATQDVQLLLEALNQYDAPGYLLATTGEAIAVIERVGCDNLMLQLDLYHCQRSEGDLSGHLRRLFGRYGHVQFSNSPGRHEPGVGEIHYPYLFALLDQLGYDGWVGCEYLPSTTSQESLNWAREWGIG
jgi:hydroxypyruvate isomerase